MKKFTIIVLVLLLAGLACLFLLAGGKPAPSRKITLPDGSTVRLVAVTYGTNHFVGSKLARITANLPSLVQDILKNVLGQRAVPIQQLTTPIPELVVWIEQRTNGQSTLPAWAGVYCEAMLADGSNFVSGAKSYNVYSPFGSIIQPLQFQVFPRRDPEISLAIFFHDPKGKIKRCDNLTFQNPEYRKYPNDWQPESLPIKKRSGDLEVTLLQFETGHDQNMSSSYDRHNRFQFSAGTNRISGDNWNLVKLKLKPLGNTNEVWAEAGVRISDATGNIVDQSGYSGDHPANSDTEGFMFSPGLWPAEKAWKLKLGLKRTAGFRPEELLVFKNVPLGELNKTNVIAWTTNFDGISFTLQSVCRHAPIDEKKGWNSTQASFVRVEHSALPAGKDMELVNMIYDNGKTNEGSLGWESSDNYHQFRFKQFPDHVQTADFIFAVQQVRFVDFMVKPELPKPGNDKKQK